MKITFHVATMDDIPEMTRIRLKFLRNIQNISDDGDIPLIGAKIDQYFRQSIRSGDFIALLARKEEKIIATSGMSFHKKPPTGINPSGKEAYIMNMYTEPPFRNRGIASTLLEKLIEYAITEKITLIRLHAEEMGRSVYKKHGFLDGRNEMVKHLLP
jgi:GNAT superfamily N-acetyltransferase